MRQIYIWKHIGKCLMLGVLLTVTLAADVPPHGIAGANQAVYQYRSHAPWLEAGFPGHPPVGKPGRSLPAQVDVKRAKNRDEARTEKKDRQDGQGSGYRIYRGL
ncbi:hypothetical protein HMSSN036_28600 [Paenibacillus macerans]|nr:hypothetical protein HMSSN036_28600 [Paenibacillus macerans]